MKRILIADDEKNMRWILEKSLKAESFQVTLSTNGEEAFNSFIDLEPDIVLLDYRMPIINGLEVLLRIRKINTTVPVIMMTAHGSTDTAVEAMKLGATDYIAKPFDVEELKIIINNALKIETMNREIDFLRIQVSESFDKVIIGKSRKISDLLEAIKKVAETSTTILITGESGTGKELVAHAIYMNSQRKDGPYIKVNCGAITEGLVESELFGHEKGAFTGAQTQKKGRFDRAQGGTIFLDEIGELNTMLQVKILRVLQEHEFERVGGTEEIKADVRIITATNRDLDEMVRNGSFREDLLYRLKIFPIHLPPLRERKEDISLLADHFIQKYAREMNKSTLSISDDALNLLTNYHFPGNIRELANIIERAIILTSSGQILPNALPKDVIKGAYNPKKPAFLLPPEGISLEEVEENFIRQALEAANGNQTHAAKLLGISRHTLIYRMEKFKMKGIDQE